MVLVNENISFDANNHSNAKFKAFGTLRPSLIDIKDLYTEDLLAQITNIVLRI